MLLALNTLAMIKLWVLLVQFRKVCFKKIKLVKKQILIFFLLESRSKDKNSSSSRVAKSQRVRRSISKVTFYQIVLYIYMYVYLIIIVF